MDSYDRWKTSSDDEYFQYECKHCDEKQEIIGEAGEWLEEIVKQVYSKDNLDIHHFENCLDMLCHLLNVKMNTGDIQISRPQVKKYQNLDLCFAYQLSQHTQGAKHE